MQYVWEGRRCTSSRRSASDSSEMCSTCTVPVFRGSSISRVASLQLNFSYIVSTSLACLFLSLLPPVPLSRYFSLPLSLGETEVCQLYTYMARTWVSSNKKIEKQKSGVHCLKQTVHSDACESHPTSARTALNRATNKQSHEISHTYRVDNI